MDKILPIVVVYKEKLEEGNTYKSLLSRLDQSVFVLYDNSPKPLYHSDDLKDGVIYIHDPMNSGLSKAYNLASQIAAKLHYDWLLLLDQDTNFDFSFYDCLNDALSQNDNVSVFVPVIKYKEGQPFSPFRYRWNRGTGTNVSPGKYRLGKLLPVNSGACVKLSAFNDVGGYNENLRLDFSDVDFFMRLSRKNYEFIVLDSLANQSFSNMEKDSDKIFTRFLSYLKDAKMCTKYGIGSRIGFLYAVLRHTLALTIRTHDIRYITKFVNFYLYSL